MKYTVRVEPTDKTRHWKLVQALKYRAFLVPIGFVTDGASIPIGLRWYFPHGGAKFPASVMHDFLYKTAPCTQLQADKVFYNMMIENGVGKFRAKLMFQALRLFGRFAWNKHRSNDNG